MQHRDQAAFFDLDRTLIGVNSAQLWVRHEYAQGRVNRRQLAEAAFWLLGYRMGVVEVERGIHRAAASLRRRLESELEAATRAWFREVIAPAFLEEGRVAVARHREQGHHVVLLTSSSPYISVLVKDELDLDHILCTRFEVVDGVFTGRIVPPICYGAGKVAVASEWAQGAGVDLGRSYFYTDSHTDLPMLEAVGHPCVVNPDPRLRRVARRRRWPVATWNSMRSVQEGAGGPETA